MKEKELGIATLFYSPLEGTISKSVIFHDRYSSEMTAKLAVTIYVSNTNPRSDENASQPNPKEYAFLLNRELRRSHSARQSFPEPPHRLDRVTFDDMKEQQIRMEARRNNFTSLPRFQQQQKRASSPSLGPKPAASLSLSGEKRNGWGRKAHSPKLRETAMSVGYVKNKWPDLAESLLEKSMYRLFLTEQRRLSLLREVEQQIRSRQRLREDTVQRIKEGSYESGVRENMLKSLLAKREKEVRLLAERLKYLQQKNTLTEAKASTRSSLAAKKLKATRNVKRVKLSDPSPSTSKSYSSERKKSKSDKNVSKPSAKIDPKLNSNEKSPIHALEGSRKGLIRAKSAPQLSHRYKSSDQDSGLSASSLSDDISLSDEAEDDRQLDRRKTDWLAPARARVHNFQDFSNFRASKSIPSSLLRRRGDETSLHSSVNPSAHSPTKRFYSYKRIGSDNEVEGDERNEGGSGVRESNHKSSNIGQELKNDESSDSDERRKGPSALTPSDNKHLENAEKKSSIKSFSFVGGPVSLDAKTENLSVAKNSPSVQHQPKSIAVNNSLFGNWESELRVGRLQQPRTSFEEEATSVRVPAFLREFLGGRDGGTEVVSSRDSRSDSRSDEYSLFEGSRGRFDSKSSSDQDSFIDSVLSASTSLSESPSTGAESSDGRKASIQSHGNLYQRRDFTRSDANSSHARSTSTTSAFRKESLVDYSGLTEREGRMESYNPEPVRSNPSPTDNFAPLRRGETAQPVNNREYRDFKDPSGFALKRSSPLLELSASNVRAQESFARSATVAAVLADSRDRPLQAGARVEVAAVAEGRGKQPARPPPPPPTPPSHILAKPSPSPQDDNDSDGDGKIASKLADQLDNIGSAIESLEVSSLRAALVVVSVFIPFHLYF